jgi:hypothetical protein
MMVQQSEQQQLVDICFQLVLVATDPKHSHHFRIMSMENKAKWVARQLEGCGFPTEPRGSSWGVLKNKD